MPDSQVVSQLTYLRDSALPGVEMLVANPSTASWCMFHDRYLLCGCTSVSTSWSYRRKSHDIEDGATGLMEPGEIHRVLAKRKASHFLTLFVDSDEFVRVAEEAGAVGVPHFQVANVADGRLLQGLAHLAGELRSGRNGLKLESSFAVLMQRTLKYTESRPVVRGSSGPALRRSLERAREILEERQNEQVTLDELAKAAALSRFHLVRSFAKEYGIPPHAYQINVRIKRACWLLRAGMPCGEVAAASGFADQSHFTRHFKKVMGVAPGIYASPHSSLRGAPSFARSADIRPAS